MFNTDEACKGMVTAGCGGIIRDGRGVWVGGFAKHIGICSAFTAELWGVLEGLQLLWRLGFRAVEFDVDFTSVVKVISDGTSSSVIGMSLLKSIRRLLELEWVVNFNHSYREANRCADALANLGCSLDNEIIFFNECPSHISKFLDADCF
ncbi:Polynucleotidyl transferase, ribonuclease H superfamily protein [Trifolium repens]|nr:Polynucleotidyl transferase, ribonuclease H superfamily protein [Trifolium repens]